MKTFKMGNIEKQFSNIEPFMVQKMYKNTRPRYRKICYLLEALMMEAFDYAMESELEIDTNIEFNSISGYYFKIQVTECAENKEYNGNGTADITGLRYAETKKELFKQIDYLIEESQEEEEPVDNDDYDWFSR